MRFKWGKKKNFSPLERFVRIEAEVDRVPGISAEENDEKCAILR